MSQKQPLVSICIPTYNRGKYLIKSLESIVVQEDFINGNVEIVISDNHSEDDTEKLCKEFCERFPQIVYHREPYNTGHGGNTNFKVVMSLASGKLLKLVNDDFVFAPMALNYFCCFEKKYENTKPQICLTNGNGAKTRENQKLYYDVTVNMDEFLYGIGHYITWIGNFSIWKEDFQKYGEDPAGITHMFWHIQETLDVLSEKNYGVIDDTVYGERQNIFGRTLSYDLYHNFYENLSAILEPFRKAGYISDERYNWLIKDLFVRFYPSNMVYQEYNIGNVRYTYPESLKKKVLERCKNEPYYCQVVNNYRKVKFNVLVVSKIRKITPKFLLDIRRRIMGQ